MVSTRDRIIVATNELFRRYGYNGTSLSQISDASSATIGSIYHFFPGGKEELGAAVIETTGTVYRQLFESIAAASADPAKAIGDVFTGAGIVLQETDFIDPCPIGGIAREVANTSELLRRAASAAIGSWITAVGDHLRSAGLESRDADELATVIVSTLEGSFVLSRTLRSTGPLGAASTHLTKLVEHAIRESQLQTLPPSY